MKGLTLTIREQSRIAVLNGVMEGKVLVAEAARLMGVSERHAWRLLRAYRKEGVAGVAHGNRGRRPSTTTCPEIQEKVMELATGAYSAFDRDAGRSGGHPSVSLHRPAGPFGRGNRSPRRPSAYLRRERSPRRECCCSRWEPAQLAGGSRTLSSAPWTSPSLCSVSRRTPTATC